MPYRITHLSAVVALFLIASVTVVMLLRKSAMEEQKSEQTSKTSESMRTIETEDGSYLVQSGPRMFDDFYLYMTQEEYDAAICQYQDSTIEIVDMPFKPVTMFNDNVLVGLWLVSDSTMFGNESNDFEEKINSMVSVAYGVDAPDEYTFDWSRFHPIQDNVDYFNVFKYEDMWVGFGHNSTSFRTGGKTNAQIVFLDHVRVNAEIEKRKLEPFLEEAKRFSNEK